jgi:hypothetical protein
VFLAYTARGRKDAMRPTSRHGLSKYGGALVLTGMFDEREKRVVFAFGVNEGYSFS